MRIKELIEKWTNEMAYIKDHIENCKSVYKLSAVASRERYEAISEMLSDIKYTENSDVILSEIIEGLENISNRYIVLDDQYVISKHVLDMYIDYLRYNIIK